MVTIKSKEENRAIHEVIKDMNSEILIGGFRFDREDIWRWDNDRTALDYINWDSGEPKQESSDEPRIYCIFMKPSDGHWKSKWCADEAIFICQNSDENSKASEK